MHLQVCLSIDGLYNRCKLAAFTTQLSTLAQLDVIGNHVSDLALITREARLPPATARNSARELQHSNSGKSGISATSTVATAVVPVH